MTAPFYSDKLNVMVYVGEDGRQHPVTSLADWQIRRHHILTHMQAVMGALPSRNRRAAPEMQILEETRERRYLRYRIAFVVEPDDRVPAYLFVPLGIEGAVPGMLCLHQTSAIGKAEPAGLGGNGNLHYARELAERGHAALAPDYPGYGDYSIDPYAQGYVSATMKGICNHRCALDLLQSLPEVDSDRLGCVGHSLGGHNTLFLSVFDDRVKVAVTSCGFNSFFKYKGGDLTGWSHKGYMPRIAERYGKDPARMPFDFTEVLAAIAPRAVFVNAPVEDLNFETSGVKDCLDAATPVFELYGQAAHLVALFPKCGHDFPNDTRNAAYRFVEQVFTEPPEKN